MGTFIIYAIVIVWCLAMVPAVLVPFLLDRPKQVAAPQPRPSTLPFRPPATPSLERIGSHHANDAAA